MLHSRRAHVVAVLFAACQLLQQASGQALPQDPANVYGKLDNGVAYIVRKHATPPNRIVLYMHVRTGAINERPTQNGIAHFLEHMAFNGSKHFPPGTLFPYLNKLGMSLGVHTNASTNYNETVYKLTMPDAAPETVDKALEVFSDYLYGLDLPQGQINRERFVILEEARTGKGPGKRLRDAMNNAVFPNTRFAEHDVIGKEDQITNFKHEDFEDYWNRWYRPENVTLIVVGDVDPKLVIEKANAAIGQFKGRGEGSPQEKIGLKPNETSGAYVFTDPEEESLHLAAMAIKAARGPTLTEADWKRDEVESMAAWIVARRYDDIKASGKAAFLEAGVGMEDVFHQATLPSIDVSAKPQEWKAALTQSIVEVKRVMDHGFTPREMELVKAEFLSNARRAVETEPTRNGTQIVGQLTALVSGREAIMSAKQELELSERIIPQITAADVVAQFKTDLADAKWMYVLTGPGKAQGAAASTQPAGADAAAFEAPSKEELMATATAAWNTATDAPAADKAGGTLLTQAVQPGKVASKTVDEGLKVTTLTFENGVVMHHRFSDYKKDSVSISLTFPGGRLTEPAGQHGVDGPASLVIQQPATSKISSTQVRDLMTGKNVSVSGGIGIDAMSMRVSGSPKDLETGMQLVYALIGDGIIEQSAFDKMVKEEILQIQQSKLIPTGAVIKGIEQVVYGNDGRLRQLTVEEVKKLDVQAAQERFHAIANHAPIEVAVSGDISEEDAERLIATYIGSLPKREGDFRQLDAARKLANPKHDLSYVTDFTTVTPMSVAMAGFQGTDIHNIHDKRALSMIARILSDRMFKRIREKDKLVYSIGCSSTPSDEIEGTGMIMAAAPTKDADALASTIIEMMDDFTKTGPTEEEMATARKQLKNTLNTSIKEPGFWSGVLSELNYKQLSLDDYRDYENIFDSFSPTELTDVARTYMKPERQIKIVVHAIAPATQPAAATKP